MPTPEEFRDMMPEDPDNNLLLRLAVLALEMAINAFVEDHEGRRETIAAMLDAQEAGECPESMPHILERLQTFETEYTR